IPPDVVNLNAAGAVGNFTDKLVGVNKTVIVTGLTVDNPDYTVSSATTTASVTPKALIVTGITASDKTYDGDTSASLDIGGATLNTARATLAVVIPPDVVHLNTAGAVGTFNNANAGVNKPVTISGLTIDNTDYTLIQPTTTATITPAATTTTLVASPLATTGG